MLQCKYINSDILIQDYSIMSVCAAMKLKEEGKVCEALREFLEPEISEEINAAKQQARAETLKDVIRKLFKAGTNAESIAELIEIPLEEVEAVLS